MNIIITCLAIIILRFGMGWGDQRVIGGYKHRRRRHRLVSSRDEGYATNANTSADATPQLGSASYTETRSGRATIRNRNYSTLATVSPSDGGWRKQMEKSKGKEMMACLSLLFSLFCDILRELHFRYTFFTLRELVLLD